MLLATALLIVMAQTPGHTSADSALRAEFMRLEEIWNTAHVRGDARALEGLWDEDLVVTAPRMSRFSHRDALDAARSGRIKFDAYESSDLEVRPYGDTVIVLGRLHRVRRIESKPVEDRWLFTKVYVRRGASWKVVAFHASEAPPEPR